MVKTLATVITNTWVQATWEEFAAIAQNPQYGETTTTKFYFDNGWMRIEDMPIGSAHGRDNLLLAAVINVYGMVKDVNYISFAGSNLQKIGERECQPDLTYYIGENIQCPPKNNQPIDIDVCGPPTLAIEISASTLNDDLGKKRLLYERINVQEYWAVDVNAAKLIAFSIADGGSRQINTSAVLPGLDIAIVEEALTRSKTEDDGTINRWLFKQFS